MDRNAGRWSASKNVARCPGNDAENSESNGKNPVDVKRGESDGQNIEAGERHAIIGHIIDEPDNGQEQQADESRCQGLRAPVRHNPLFHQVHFWL